MPLSLEASWCRVELTVLRAGDGGMLPVRLVRSLNAIGVTSGEGDPVVCVCVCVGGWVKTPTDAGYLV